MASLGMVLMLKQSKIFKKKMPVGIGEDGWSSKKIVCQEEEEDLVLILGFCY